MALPSHIDEYTTHKKMKYMSGFVVSSGSVNGSNGTAIYNDAILEIIDSTGTTYYLALYDSLP